ncbi:MAG: Ig-like domain-containing protein [Pseudonocardiaceae bacterium]
MTIQGRAPSVRRLRASARRTVPFGVAIVVAAASTVAILASPAAAATSDEIVDSLDVTPATVTAAAVVGDPQAVATLNAPINGFPTNGSNYLVISTGDAAAVPGSDPATFVSTNLPAAAAGADGNDLTQVKLTLIPPTSATCVAFDFGFLSEEFPEFVGSSFNDIFTAELNESLFSVEGNQVIAPNNFAYDSQGNAVSINTVFGLAQVPGTTMDGSTPPLSATSPVEKKLDGSMDLFLSVQDIGDSIYDTAVIIDNLRWLSGPNCTAGTTPIVDTDGDGLSDVWETQGIDYDNDGTAELDLPAMGADPNHKDLFIEIDWMVKEDTCVWLICFGGRSFEPQPDALADVVAAFAAAPVPNPDGSTGIRMHIDSGPQSVMDPRTGATWGQRSRASAGGHQKTLGTFDGGDYNWAEFESRKSSDFDLFRRDAFHYVLYADRYGSDNNGSSGISRGIPGSDLLVTDGHESWGGGFSRTQERGTYMHELGHGLSLRHGGGDDTNNKPDYESIMNYLFQLVGLPPDSRVDYSRGAPYVDWDNLRFDGGSIGDLGDANPQPTTTPVDSLDSETARQLGVFARSGDGIIDIVGPTVLLPNTGTQTIQLDVTNHGPTPETFTAKLTSNAPALAGETSAPVPAGSTARFTIPVNTAQLQPGEYDISASLSSPAGEGLFTDTGQVTVPDTADPAVRQAAKDALDQLNGLPADSGLDPAVKDQLSEMLTAVGDNPPVAVDDTYTTPEDTPLTAPLPGVLGNDTDPDNDPLTAAVVTGPAHGTVTLNADGSFAYTPALDFTGTDSFTYTADDGTATSNTATVTLTVTPVNDAPTVAVAAGGSCDTNGTTATSVLALADPDTNPATLTVTATSSNQPLLPNASLTPGGAGATRTLTAATIPTSSGQAIVTITVSDGAATATTTLTVIAGTNSFNTLTGTAGPDVLLGKNGIDTLNAGAGIDLLCGGGGFTDTLSGEGGDDTLDGQAGNDALVGGPGNDILRGGPGSDALTGGPGADAFSGGPGGDINLDFTPAQGDTTDGT